MSVQADAPSRPALIFAFAVVLGLLLIGLSGQGNRTGPTGATGDAASQAFRISQANVAVETLAPASSEDAGKSGADNKSQSAAPPTTIKPAKPAPRLFTHTVEPGDTLSGIAKRYGISTRTIQALNALDNPNMLKVGQKLRILSVDGTVHKVRQGETLWQISRWYSLSVDKILKANPSVDPDHLSVGTQLILPGVIPHDTAGSPRPAKRSSTLSSRGGTASFIWPVVGRITSSFGSRWGSFHEGIDVAVPAGTPVRAADDGRVVYSGWYGSYGKLVIIDHGNGYRTRYGHNSALFVSNGEWVSRGQVVASVGTTGRATGPHLHFEVRHDGQALNPTSFLR